MIFGIGVDIVEIYRIQKAIENSGYRFINRIFTQKEQEYCKSQKNMFQHFAARFAAKEAVLKALKLGWNSVDWKTIEIEGNLSGEPQVILYGKTKEICQKKNIDRVFLSITHFGNYAVAFVVLEGSNRNE